MLVYQDFSGVPAGDTLTLANSVADGQTALDSVALGSGSGAVADAATPIHGKNSLHVTTPATATTVLLGWNSSTLGASASLWARAYLRLGAVASNTNVMRFTANGTSTALATLTQMTSGALRLWNSAVSLTIDAPAVPTGQWIRVEVRILASTTAGEAELRVFTDPEGTTADISPAAATGILFPAAVANTIRAGVTGPVANTSYHIADLAASDTDWIGPYVAPVATPVAYYDDGTSLIPVDAYYDDGTQMVPVTTA